MEPGSTSVLENMLAGLAEPTTVHSGDNTFNRSVSMDNQKTSSYGRQITRYRLLGSRAFCVADAHYFL